MHFVDSNVWLYAVIRHHDTVKCETAKSLVESFRALVSTQVVNEVCRNLRQKGGYDDRKLKTVIVGFYRNCEVVPVEQATMLKACTLRERHSFSFWDSLMVAAALAADCDILYSEDMQDGLVVDGTLTIVNPFRDS